MKNIFTFLLTISSFLLLGQGLNPAVITPRLEQAVNEKPEEWHKVLLLLADRTDISTLKTRFETQNLSLSERNVQLIAKLKEKAQATQAPFLQNLNNSSSAKNVHSFWITNLMYAEVKADMLASLSHDPAFELIDLDVDLQLDKHTDEKPALPVPNGKEAGLRAIDADTMWAMGYTGYGRIAFTSDTGTDPTHPALISNYRGNYEASTASWFEYQSNSDYPFDCDDHGTHVTGTMVGLDRLTNDTIGVAFNAQWISSPSICFGTGTASNIAAFQWALDPDGNPATIEDMPDVVNNSWFDPSISDECNSIYLSTLDALEATKVAVVFSAGNEGENGPLTITSPKNINTDLVNAFSVGALNGNGSLFNIADFSSRGPSICGGESSLHIKPEVSAPGVSVRSCVPGGGYDLKSGTSMAAPHVSGAILLLREAFPNTSATEVKSALYFSAFDLGEEGEDNVYGMGIINVPAAYDYLVEQGHTPVPPAPRQVDVVAVNATIQPTVCPDNFYALVHFENNGTDTLNSVSINYQVEAATQTYAWTGSLAPGQITSVLLETQSLTPGNKTLTVDFTQPNNTDDQRPLNNKIIRRFDVVDSTPLVVSVEGNAETYCTSGGILLRAEYQGLGAADVSWFDVPFGGFAFANGEVVAVENVTESTVYYAAADHLLPAGKNTPGSNFELAEAAGVGLRFDAFQPFKLESALVYFETPGLRLFKLKNSEGETLAQKVTNLNGDSPMRVDFNFNVPQANNLSIVHEQGDPIMIDTEFADFPYVLNDVLRVEQSLGANIVVSLSEYHGFYDWEVRVEDPCGRVPVELTVVEAEEAPIAAFEADLLEVSLNAGGEVSFINNSENALEYIWNFGDGSPISTESSPNHIFTEGGVYSVSLTVFDENGCSDAVFLEIIVIDDVTSSVSESDYFENNILIYPNPTADVMTIAFDLDRNSALRYSLVDMHGRTVFSVAEENIGMQTKQHDVSRLAAGVYYFIFENENGKTVKKMVKM